MSNKPRLSCIPTVKNAKFARPSTVGVPTSSSNSVRSSFRVPQKTSSEKVTKCKINKNATILAEADTTVKSDDSSSAPDVEKQIAYSKFLRAMLAECFIDEKIEREETAIDVQISQLADRFKKTVDQLDKTGQRLKNISFVVEQKRLIDLKSQDCSRFYEISDNSNTPDLLQDLTNTEQAHLDILETKNIDMGYDKDSGHKQLLDAVTEAIEGFEEIKKHSNLDIDKFKQYGLAQKNLEDLEESRFQLASLEEDFRTKFPKFHENLFKQASDTIASVLRDDGNDFLDDL